MTNGETKLPPHSLEAEAGLLGCVLDQGSGQILTTARERIRVPEVFYDMRHRLLFETLCHMQDEQQPLLMVAVRQRLHDMGNLEQVGGPEYLGQLADHAVVLDVHLKTVLEKFYLRRLVQNCILSVQQVTETEGAFDGVLANLDLELDRIKSERQGQEGPRFLVPVSDFAEAAGDRFFHRHGEGEPGLELPIDFKLKIRPQESTIVIGDDKTGKSTLLSYFLVHLAHQGMKTCVASMEMPPPVIIWILASQLLGVNELPESEQSRAVITRAMAWINARFVIYGFLGITDWRDLLRAFRHANEKHGSTAFLIDSVMRIGIPDDDYAQQGQAAAEFAQFAMESQSHLFYVCHENKSTEGKGKKKARGSALWTANACNILRVERNLSKGEKIDGFYQDIDAEKRSSTPDKEWIDETYKKINQLREEWDTRVVLHGQRYPFSTQNASRRFWFHRASGQFHTHWSDPPVNWLDKWTKRE